MKFPLIANRQKKKKNGGTYTCTEWNSSLQMRTYHFMNEPRGYYGKWYKTDTEKINSMASIGEISFKNWIWRV